jgi:hypothetical protein
MRPTEERRDGASIERTQLSWWRTALAALALAAVGFKVGVARTDVMGFLLGGFATACAGVLFVAGRLLISDASRRSHAAPAGLIAMAAALVVTAGATATVAVGVWLAAG